MRKKFGKSEMFIVYLQWISGVREMDREWTDNGSVTLGKSETIKQPKPMAKVLIKEGTSFELAAAELANIGITLDRHKLGDGTHRAYVRKQNKPIFEAFIASFTSQPRRRA